MYFEGERGGGKLPGISARLGLEEGDACLTCSDFVDCPWGGGVLREYKMRGVTHRETIPSFWDKEFHTGFLLGRASSPSAPT